MQTSTIEGTHAKVLQFMELDCSKSKIGTLLITKVTFKKQLILILMNILLNLIWNKYRGKQMNSAFPLFRNSLVQTAEIRNC